MGCSAVCLFGVAGSAQFGVVALRRRRCLAGAGLDGLEGLCPEPVVAGAVWVCAGGFAWDAGVCDPEELSGSWEAGDCVAVGGCVACPAAWLAWPYPPDSVPGGHSRQIPRIAARVIFGLAGPTARIP